MKVCIDSSKRYIFIFRGISAKENDFMRQRIKEWLAGNDKMIALSSTNTLMELESVIEVCDDRERASMSVCETGSAGIAWIGPPPSEPFRYGPDEGFYGNTIAHKDADGMLTACSVPIIHGNIGDASRIKEFILWLNNRKTVSKQ